MMDHIIRNHQLQLEFLWTGANLYLHSGDITDPQAKRLVREALNDVADATRLLARANRALEIPHLLAAVDAVLEEYEETTVIDAAKLDALAKAFQAADGPGRLFRQRCADAKRINMEDAT